MQIRFWYSRHARIVLLSTGGMANRRIGTLVDCSMQWVRQVIHRFNDHGIAGITWFPWFQGTPDWPKLLVSSPTIRRLRTVEFQGFAVRGRERQRSP